MAHIQKKKTKDGIVSYQAQIRLKGFPNQGATFQKKTDALKWAKQTEASIYEGRYFKTSESKKRTLGEAIDRYINTIIPTKGILYGKSRKQQLLWWKKELGYTFLSEIRPSIITDKKEKLFVEITKTGKPRDSSTIARYLSSLSHLLGIACIQWEWIDDFPMKKVSKPKTKNGRCRFLNTHEIKRLLDACKNSPYPYFYELVMVALSTGMRKGEITHLLWSDIDFNSKRIILNKTKNGERRTVPLSTGILKILKNLKYVSKMESFLVFPKSNHPLRPILLYIYWKDVLKEGEIFDFKFHDLRHTFASYLAMNSASLSEIAEALGHKTTQMVKRYAHLSESHTAGVIERMNEKIFGGCE